MQPRISSLCVLTDVDALVVICPLNTGYGKLRYPIKFFQLVNTIYNLFGVRVAFKDWLSGANLICGQVWSDPCLSRILRLWPLCWRGLCR